LNSKLHSIYGLLCLLYFFQIEPAHSQSVRGVHKDISTAIYTEDIDNFYSAFDQAIKDTVNAKGIFKKEYFAKGSKGLKDFLKTKIKDIEQFSKFVIRNKVFYQSIRKDILDIEDLEKQVYSNSEAFKNLYTNAVFPNIYFVIGRFSSNGTISKRGLLIGTEILGRTEKTDTKNWNKNILRISLLRSHIPITVAHELIHFNQSKMEEQNSLLWKSMIEGSAEFIAELITGETDGNYSKFEGREVEIWEDFKKEMNNSYWSSWKSWHQASDKRPRNADYWAGYLIYEQNSDSKKTIDAILNIKDYNAFYQEAQVDKYINEKFKQ